MEKFKKTRFQFICKRYFRLLINYLGEKGTLIIPTFNFDFCSGKIYDIKNTKSQMGIFSEIARIEAVKTDHGIPYTLLFYSGTFQSKN